MSWYFSEKNKTKNNKIKIFNNKNDKITYVKKLHM